MKAGELNIDRVVLELLGGHELSTQTVSLALPGLNLVIRSNSDQLLGNADPSTVGSVDETFITMTLESWLFSAKLERSDLMDSIIAFGVESFLVISGSAKSLIVFPTLNMVPGVIC